MTTVDGSASASVGRTMALIGIQPKVVSWKETKNEDTGRIVGKYCSGTENVTFASCTLRIVLVQVEFPSICHRDIRSGRTFEDAVLVKESLEDVLEHVLESNCFCIVQDKYYWFLQITAYCISFDGNAMETFLLALYGALLDLRLPVVRPNSSGELLAIDQSQSKTTVAMKKVEEWPWVTAVGVFSGKSSEPYFVLDLTQEEENNMNSIVWIWNNQKQDKLKLSKHRAGSLSENMLKKVLELAKAHTVEMVVRLQHDK